MKKLKLFIIVFVFLFSTDVWAKSWSQIISLSKRDTAISCIKDAEDGYLELKIKRNIDIPLPLTEIEKFLENDGKWNLEDEQWSHGLLQDVYNVNFLNDLEKMCTSLQPLWRNMYGDDLQEYFKNKTKAKLSDLVVNRCRVGEKQINGRVFEAMYILEISRTPMIEYWTTHEFKYTRGFFFKVDGLCPDEISSQLPKK